MSKVLELTRSLIERRSVTPEDAGCQELIAGLLAEAGFEVEQLNFGAVHNLYAWHGEAAPRVVFLGHTDVVPAGPEDQWASPPFEPTERAGRLFGRGAADMKGAVAAMVEALRGFIAARPEHAGSVGLLLTSDEEGLAEDGIRKVIPALEQQGIRFDQCVVGEPSSLNRLGDNIRIGRRGSLNLEIHIEGVQGHVAYPNLAENPIHRALPALAALVERTWDEGNEHFPPTSFQIAEAKAGNGVYNVIPGELRIRCNFRYSPLWTPQALTRDVRHLLERFGLVFRLEAQDSGRPFYTEPGPLIQAAVAACETVCDISPHLDTGGGTSDGRFVAPTGAAVVEIGVVNKSIHQINEWVEIEELDQLRRIYREILETLLCT